MQPTTVFTRSVAAFACCSLLTAVSTAQEPGATHPAPTGQDVVATAVAAGKFQTLVAAVKAADLVGTLQGKGPFTVFAPTDEAFARLGKDTLGELLKPENKAQLSNILTNHVVAGELAATAVVARRHLTTVGGGSLAVSADQDGVRIDGAKVVGTDVRASNGTIHVIDSVLLPKPNLVATAAKAGAFQTLLTAATAAGLADTLAKGGPFTIFAPTDAAFAQLGKDTLDELLKPENKARLAAILKHHVVAGTVRAAEVVQQKTTRTLHGSELPIVVDGDTVRVGGAKVVTTDVLAGNGVIHVIDAVLLPQ
ncbi:MAG: fasciclin domain-containing protein [Planctomycetes bacterium]|nr:fasciclin domain-containing protein [Planctomycetota bacterium]MCC7396925.1 fasciclin domain-containing protein [Planctomycetota bacterium]